MKHKLGIGILYWQESITLSKTMYWN